MIQISDRTDFATRLAYFMTAQQHLAKSGVQPTGESLEESTNKFLDQFTTPAQQTRTVSHITLPVGYVIIDSEKGKISTLFNRSLYRTNEQAFADLDKTILTSHHHLYQIKPVYV